LSRATVSVARPGMALGSGIAFGVDAVVEGLPMVTVLGAEDRVAMNAATPTTVATIRAANAMGRLGLAFLV